MAAPRLLWIPLTSAAVTVTPAASHSIATTKISRAVVNETNEQATRRDDTCVERIQRQR